MSSAEFELWVALALQRAEECPNCGREPREIGQWEYLKLKCPTCAYEYARVREAGSRWRLLDRAIH